jgi:hypothetical protein
MRSARSHHTALGLGELGVDQDERAALGIVLRPLGIDHDEADRRTHLGRCEADAGLVVHHVAHVTRERTDLVRDLLHGLGDESQTLVGKLQDFSKGHRSTCFAVGRGM